MTDELLTTLRYKSEGTDIDFKSAQYRFISGSENDKAEMLKDILAIANAWRDGPGYILLGFKDQRPHPAALVGISESIDDAKMQQFVHGKVKPKLTFKYEEHLYQGKTVGVITIPKQKRVFYLAHAYGKLKSNVVYVRRGSSTDEAEPMEIADMVLADTGRRDVRLDLSVLAPNNEELNTTFELNYLKFPERLPDYESPPIETGPFGFLSHAPSLWNDNRHFWREYAEYVRLREALIEMKFILHNRSEVQLSNAKLEVSVEPLDGQGFQMMPGADLPNEPRTQWNSISGMHSLLDRRDAQLVVDDSGRSPICHVRFGSLLPGEECRSSGTVAIIPLGPGKLRLRLRILGGELTTPQESERVLEATGEVKELDVDGLKQMWGKSQLARHQPIG
ncbi:ATP-binding protein [Ralstonia nicotianae]